MTEARNIARPEPGLFKMRLVRGGVFVAARIWRPCHCTPVGGAEQREHDWTPACDRFPQLAAEIDGMPEAARPGTEAAKPLFAALARRRAELRGALV